MKVSRYRTRRMYEELGTCERCQNQATERHHKNGDLDDYSRENIEFLCRSCHLMHHYAPKFCVKCNKEAKPMRKGLCHSCYECKRKKEKRQTRKAQYNQAQAKGA